MDALAVLKESLAAWRKTRHPRWGQLADWASARALAASPERPVVGASGKKADHEAWTKLEADGHALDLPRLVASLNGPKSPAAAERVAVLALRDDPRLVTLLMKVLEAPPFRAKTALPFFRAVCQALVDSRDVRAREAMRELSGRFKAVLETSVGDDVAALLRRSAAALDELPAPSLSPADEARLAELERHFDGEFRAIASSTSEKKRAKKTDDELLAAVYAAPDDDGPRMVFADALLERGDLRGELIQLQLQRARGEGTAATLARERELAGDRKRLTAWGLPLSNGGECTLERGFPQEVIVQARTAKSIVGLAAWATVNAVAGLEGLSQKQVNELLSAEPAKHLRTVGRLKAAPKLAQPPGWTDVSFAYLPERETLERLPALTALTVSAANEATWTKDALRGAPGLRRYTQATGPLPDAAELPELEALDLSMRYGEPPPGFLSRFSKLEVLRLSAVKSLDLLRGLPLRELSIGQYTGDLPELLAAIPGVTALDWRWLSSPERLAAFLDAARGTRLDRLSLNTLTLTGLASGGATAIISGAHQLAQVQPLVSALTPAHVACVVLRPPIPGSPTFLPPPPTDAVLAPLADAMKARGLPFEVDWS